MADAAMQSEYQ